jgi:hypothetical protein
VAGDVAAVFEDLRGERIFVLRHVAELFQERQVDVAFHVAHGAGIAVPVPGAAEVAGVLHHADALEAGLAQPRAHQQAAEPAADDRELHLVGDRVAGEARLHIGVVDVVGIFRLDLDVLARAVLAQALVALGQVFRMQGVGIEIDLADDLGQFRWDAHGRHLGAKRAMLVNRLGRGAPAA